jgi:hypothetical protein
MSPGSWFLVLIWVFLLPPMLAVEADDCTATRRCGNLNISQPFWLSDRETGSCGLLDFEVYCNNSITPFLRSSLGLTFAIIDILYEQRSLHVVDIYDKTALKICHVPGWNTSAKLGLPYKISPENLNLIMYNCTAEAAAVARRDSKLVPMRCRNESSTFVRTGVPYDEMSDYASYAIGGCNATVVPVLGSKSGAANASDYAQLIGDGFLLTWEPPPLPPLPSPLPVPAPARKFTHPSNHLSVSS